MSYVTVRLIARDQRLAKNDRIIIVRKVTVIKWFIEK